MNEGQDVAATVGRILHFVTDRGCLPGIVVRQHPDNSVNLKVSTDNEDSEVWVLKINENPKYKEINTWHWPRYCSHIPEEKED